MCSFHGAALPALSLSLGLRPLVELRPASGKMGDAVNILGSDLTSATGVTFNGMPATFQCEIEILKSSLLYPPRANKEGPHRAIRDH